VALVLIPLTVAAAPRASRTTPFNVVEATIPEMAAAMKEGRITSRGLVTAYLTRIALYEGKVNAIIAVNPRALEEADERDRERAKGKVRGPLHGIPIALKDNIHTTHMPTTGGALAFAGFVPPYEATLTRNLREAGAIIIAKTVLTELAGSVGDMPGNYSAVGGYGFNPYDLRRDPREATFGQPALTPAGSSSGSGTSASFWAASVGTETSGSILGPAFLNMLVGIKPTLGRISRHGIIPLSRDQDTAGPMARTVADAAVVLGALEGATPDPNDDATLRCTPPPRRDYTRFLRADALKGARIGIPRAFFYEAASPPGGKEPRGGLTPEQRAMMTEAFAVLEREGAILVDPADIPSIVDTDPGRSFLSWHRCSGTAPAKAWDQGCSIVMTYAMKRDFNAWLASLGPGAPVATLTALREWNLAHMKAGAIQDGQGGLDAADALDLDADGARYRADRAKDIALTTRHGIDEVMSAQRLDALLFPMSRGAPVSAPAGYPTIIVPFGSVPNAPKDPFPPGFDPAPWPFGVSFTGTACSEPRLIALAHAFEQATKRRVPPPGLP
jgi:amidase